MNEVIQVKHLALYLAHSKCSVDVTILFAHDMCIWDLQNRCKGICGKRAYHTFVSERDTRVGVFVGVRSIGIHLHKVFMHM